MKIYKSAIVGCGRIGCFLDNDPKRKGVIWTHAGAYKANKRTELVALVDSDENTRKLASDRWGIKATYSQLDHLLKERRVDILSICTPSSSHAQLFQRAISAKIPAIWCEKPMTATVADAEKLVGISQRSVTSINHTRRWDKAYEIARKQIEAGRLGHLLNATAWYTNGVANMGSHLFDILRYLLGDAVSVRAAKAGQEPDPTLSGTILFSNNVLCQVIGYEPGHAFIFEIDILGSEGRMRISEDGTKVELSKAIASTRYTGFREFSAPRVISKGPDGKRMLTALNEIVRGLDDGTPTRCPALDGLKTVELIAAMIRSAQTNRSLDLPLIGEDRQTAIPVR